MTQDQWKPPRHAANEAGVCASLSIGRHPLGDNPHHNRGNGLRYCDDCAALINRHNVLGDKAMCQPVSTETP